MEELSVVSGATTNGALEVSDSNSSSFHLHQRTELNMSPSKFKGVVCQQNGHWGAQIYANHQRIWLGTFKSEKEAAMAYDSAAIKLRNGDSYRNFQWTEVTKHEPGFQNQFSIEEVLGMIKDSSYASKFSNYLKTLVKEDQSSKPLPNPRGFSTRQLFQKELTPSDVGKLNRLVIPKKYAVKHFKDISDVEGQHGGTVGDEELVFFDQSMRQWKFRYCYWKSSQSFVFTRGWNKFARDKGLKSKDRIIFSECEYNDGLRIIRMIDVSYYDGVNHAPVSGNNADALRLQIGVPVNGDAVKMELDKQGEVDGEEDSKSGEGRHCLGSCSTSFKGKGFKLFGVQIS